MQKADIEKHFTQSILFNKALWTARRAKSWLARHGYKHSKVHETKRYFRFRQFDPDVGDKYVTRSAKCEHARCNNKGIKKVIVIGG